MVVVLIAEFLIVGGGGARYGGSLNHAPRPARRTGPHKLIVSKDPNRAGAFATIHRALSEAKVGSIIELWDDIDECHH